MPHNNRMSTSAALKTSDIWSKTIGHDPYAAAGELQTQDESNGVADAEKARGLLALARHQNIAGDTASRDDFARKMYLGLKSGKKHRGGGLVAASGDAKLQEILEQESSSSEDEYVATIKGEYAIKKDPRNRDEESSEGGDSDSDDSSRRRRKRKDKKKSRKKHSKKYESESSDDSDDSEEERRRRKRKRRRKEERKRRHRDDDDEDRKQRRRRERDCGSDDDDGSSRDGPRWRKDRKSEHRK